MANHKVGIDYLKSREHLADVSGLELFLTRNCDGSLFEFSFFDNTLEIDLLKVKDYVRDIFLNACNGIEFVADAVNFNRGNSKAFERRQQYSTESVAHSDAIAGFQRLELKLAVEIVGFQHEDPVGFLEC